MSAGGNRTPSRRAPAPDKPTGRRSGNHTIGRETPETQARGAAQGPYGYVAGKDALSRRLHRIEGQVRGIERMIDEDRYCIDIITQIAAVNTALEAVGLKILDEHVKHCVSGALASGDEQIVAQKSQELLHAVQRFTRAR